MVYAQRLKGLGNSVFSDMDNLRLQLEAQGQRLINLSIGSPDRAPSFAVRRVLAEAVMDENVYGYTLTRGTAEFRQSCVRWYKQRFGIDLDAEREVLPLMGSQDGLAHIFWALIDHGESALIPDPGYPIYTAGLLLAGGRKVSVPLRQENGFLPDLRAIDAQVARAAKLIFLNYPNNPTAAVASKQFFAEVVEFAREYDIIVCHDAAYSELAFGGFRPASFLEVPGAKEVGIEFHSVSKTYNLAGLRLGMVVGNADVVAALTQVKGNIDYGVFLPALRAATVALAGDQAEVEENKLAYQRRRDLWVDGCAAAGWSMNRPRGSMFVWAPVPTGQDSFSFAVDLAKKAGILVVPGIGFGDCGEGYVRIALVQEEPVMREAVERVRAFLEWK